MASTHYIWLFRDAFDTYFEPNRWVLKSTFGLRRSWPEYQSFYRVNLWAVRLKILSLVQWLRLRFQASNAGGCGPIPWGSKIPYVMPCVCVCVCVCVYTHMGVPGGASGKEPTHECKRRRRHRFDPWVGKIPWRRTYQPTPVFLPGESHGQRSLGDTFHSVAKSWTWLKHACIYIYIWSDKI